MTIVLNKADYARLVKTLDAAGDLDTRPAIQRSLRDGANSMKTAGKANLSSRNNSVTGNLKRSFTIKVTKRKKIGSNYALSGFKRSTRYNKIGGGNHSYLVDSGTRKRWTNKAYTDKLGRTYPSGMYRGSVSKGRPQIGTRFWRDAVQSEGPRALNNLVYVIEGELKKLMG